MLVDPPVGTVTFLFTDLEGSTRLWREHPDAMQPALARHDAILRDTIAAHDGHLVKATGDGAHAVFGNASDAVAAAITAQLALAAENWPLPEPLRVRMGIHSGTAEVRDGDYFGTTVNRAARLMGIAHGGQRHHDLAAVRDAHQARRSIHRRAEVVVVAHFGGAAVDPHPDPQGFGQRPILSPERELRRDRGRNGV